MKKVPFIIKSLSIRKMPGFPRGLKHFEDFAEHINIITGPNASGKSSTARAIQKSIWRDKTAGLEAESTALINDEPWTITIDSGRVNIQRKGLEDELAGIPSKETSGRYMLALHELVQEDEQGLAAQIYRESIGGLDLDQARDNLNYSTSTRKKSSQEFKSFKEAKNQYDEALRKQKVLSNDEKKLSELQKKLEQADKAIQLKELYEKVISWLEEKQKVEHLEAELKQYPQESLEKSTGEEYSQIKNLEKELEDAEREIQDASEKINENKRLISQLSIPESGVEDEVLNEAELLINKLENIQQKIHEKEDKIKAYESKAAEALKNIDTEIDPAAWKGLKLDDVSKLDAFIGEAQQVFGKKQYLENEVAWLKKQQDDTEKQDAEKLMEGIRLLSYWLQESENQEGISKNWLWSIFAVAVLTTIVTFYAGVYGLAGLILLLVMLIYFSTLTSAGTTGNRKRDYEKTGLSVPDEWNTEKVTERLDGLIEALKSAHWHERLIGEAERRQKELEELKGQAEKVLNTYQSWKEKLRAVPGLPEENVNSFSGMSWFLTYVKSYNENQAEVVALEAQLKQQKDSFRHTLELLNSHLSQQNLNEAETLEQARAKLKKLQEEENLRRNAVKEIERQDQTIVKQEKQLQGKKEKLKEVYEKLDVAEGDKDTVSRLMDKRKRFNELKSSHDSKKQTLADKKDEMQNHPNYEAYSAQIQALDVSKAKELIGQFKEEADKRDEIKGDIKTIEVNIENAKAEYEVEKMLSKLDEAREDLERLYEDNMSSVTGAILVDMLKNEARTENQPKVLKRADELLINITQGRYSILLDDKSEASFSAFDNNKKKGVALDKLSTGSRIQLLLSVRLAYIETVEPYLKLPVLADELLANSDDIRAKAVIEALAGISREGRQVFYFTAQHDEVEKWMTYLDANKDLESKVFQLSGNDQNPPDYLRKEVKEEKLSLLNKVPSPDKNSPDEYARKIGVPSYDLLADIPESLHLWYLVEDMNKLQDLLTRGIKYWGQFINYVSLQETPKVFSSDEIKAMQKKVNLLKRYQEMYQKGRPKPVGRDVLEASGAITPTYIDQVSEKLKACGHDPVKLMEALYNNEVKRFNKDKKTELENYLKDNGFIPNQEPVSVDQILVAIQAYISSAGLDLREAEMFIGRIQGRGNKP